MKVAKLRALIRISKEHFFALIRIYGQYEKNLLSEDSKVGLWVLTILIF